MPLLYSHSFILYKHPNVPCESQISLQFLLNLVTFGLASSVFY